MAFESDPLEELTGKKKIRRPREPKYKKERTVASMSYRIQPHSEIFERFLSVRDAAILKRALESREIDIVKVGSLMRGLRWLLRTKAAVRARKALRWMSPGYHARRVKRYKSIIRSKGVMPGGAQVRMRRGILVGPPGRKRQVGSTMERLEERLRQARRARNIRYGVGGLAALGAGKGLVERRKRRREAVQYSQYYG